jgi:hypothetical protein
MNLQLPKLKLLRFNEKIFLGGTTNKSDWRDILIKKIKIEYFNPVVSDWDDNAQKEEIKQRKTVIMYYM